MRVFIDDGVPVLVQRILAPRTGARGSRSRRCLRRSASGTSHRGDTYPDAVTHAIIVAAGSGTRLGAGRPKALVDIAGAPLVAWSVRAFARCRSIVVAAPPGHEEDVAAALEGIVLPHTMIVTGGETRQHSVKRALDRLPQEAERVLVHDAARPLVTPDLVQAIIDALDDEDGAIAASPVADTLKRADDDGTVAATVDRANLWSAQTPQGFRAAAMRRVFDAADDAVLARSTDCASMMEAAGYRIRLVDSRTPNMKVTTPADAVVAATLLRLAGQANEGSAPRS